ncbi:tripartite tricarboxylate transporter substrate binding protein [Spirochaeta cellobiosiphila]|uniref:tripartite tricarboxylate transporter substrate binding protein n=1 Tax=Spirochaeta cellobiosiphila TaxID=504483 RepID=UPI0004249FBC|nr:tripartite tricarboxylate transporter substrate binding protein [Spirochaeta cellobiosiphila]
MKRFLSILCVLTFFTGILVAEGSQEGSYPTKSINLIVPFSAGGGTDAVARALAKSAEKYLGQSVVVLNKTGGSGAVGMTAGATATPDGYTITMITREIVSLPLMGLAQISPDDFDLVRLVNLDPALLAVKSDSSYANIDQIIDAAKKNPGSIKFASTAKPNFYILALENNQNIKFNQIPFNGAGEAIPSVIGGHTDFTIASPGELISQIQGDQLRPVAIMAPERIDSMPEVPTFRELGYDVVSGTWRGIAVPKGTPESIRTGLEEAFAKAVADPDFVAFMKNAKLGIYDLDSAAFAQYIKADTDTIQEIVSKLK